VKKKVTTVIFGIIFFIGLLLLLYPYLSNQWNTYRQKQLIDSYEEAVSGKEAAGEIDYESERARAEAYNDLLLPGIFSDSFAVAEATEEDENYLACLNLAGDGIMGKIEIPKIGITLPVYHTTGEEVLEKAAGHLEGSSLPIGGESTHSVIAAHRGLPSAALFTDLDKLEEGDHFLLYVLNEILCYEVDQIQVVTPDKTESLAVEQGQDLVTLVTCTPYGVNTHRLLVRGHRVTYVPEEVEEEQAISGMVSMHTNYLFWVAIGLAVTGVFILILFLTEKRTTNEKKKN
jgi:sortase A